MCTTGRVKPGDAEAQAGDAVLVALPDTVALVSSPGTLSRPPFTVIANVGRPPESPRASVAEPATEKPPRFIDPPAKATAVSRCRSSR